MPSVDNRVVEMRFDNKEFEDGVSTSLKSIDKLKNALNFSGAEKGLGDIDKAARGIDFSSLTSAANTLNEHFSALGIIGDQVLRGIGNEIDSVRLKTEQMIKSLSIDQITAGWEKYAEKTEAVQTIMAATSTERAWVSTEEQMEFVNEQLEKLMWFSDETSYSFVDMTGNIGKFTSNGEKLEDSVKAMQGISTWAAISGANTQEASRAMYNLSQALSTGAVKLIDWKSIQNANMATVEFKQTALDTAVAVGTLNKVSDDTYETMAGHEVTVQNFTDAMKDEWFTSKVLMDTLEQYGGFATRLYETMDLDNLSTSMTTSKMIQYIDQFKDGTIDFGEASEATGLSVEELKHELSELSSEEFDLGRRAFRAAQEAKTFKEAIDATKDAVSSGWMETFELIFGNYEEAKSMWTNLANNLWDLFAAGSDARNEELEKWHDGMEGVADGVSGYTMMLEAASNVWEIFMSILGTVKDAWQEVFPPMAAERLLEITAGVRDFTAKIKDALGHVKEVTQPVVDAVTGAAQAVETVTETAATVEEMANRVISGEFGNGEDRRQALEALGLSYEKIQNKVNEILGCDYRLEVAEDEVVEATGEHTEAIQEQQEAMDESVASFEVQHTLLENLSRIIKGVASAVDIVKQTVSAVWRAVIQPILTKLVQLIFPAAEFLGDIGDQITAIAQRWRENDTIFNGINYVVNQIKAAWQWLKDLWAELGQNESIVALGNTLRSVWDTLKGIASTVYDNVTGFFESFDSSNIPLPTIEDFANAIGWVAEKINKLITTVRGWDIWDRIANGYNQVKDYFSKLDIGLPKFGEFFASLEGKTFTEKLTVIWQGIKNVWARVKEIWADLVDIISGASLTEAVDENGNVIKQSIFDRVPILGFFKGIYDQVKPVVDKIWSSVGTGITSIGSFFTKIWGYFGKFNGKSLTEIFTTLWSDIQTAWQSIIGFFTGLSTSQPITWIQTVLSTISSTFSNATTAITNFLSSISPERIAGLGLMVAGIASLVGLLKTFKSAKNMFGSIGGFFDVLTKSKQGDKGVKIGATVLEIAAAIGILAGSLYLLSTIPVDELKSTAIVLFELMGALLIFTAALAAISQWMMKSDTAAEKFTALSIGVLAISGSILLLAVALKVLSTVDFEGIGPKLLTLAIMLGVAVGAMILIGKFGPSSITGAASLLIFAISLNVMVAALEKLANAPLEQIKGKFGLLLEIIGMLGLLSFATKGSSLSSGLGITVLILDLLLIVKVMDMLKDVTMEDLWAGVQKVGVMVLVLAALAAVMRLAGSNATSIVKEGKNFTKQKSGILQTALAIVLMSASLLIIAEAIRQIGAIPEGQLKQGAVVVGAMFGFFMALTVLSQYAGQHSAKVGVAILLMSASVLILGKAIKYIGDLTLKEVIQGGLVVGALLGLFALMMAVGKAAETSTKTIILVVVAIGMMTAAFYILQNIPTEKLLGIAVSLGGVFLALAVAFKLLGNMSGKGVATGILGFIAIIAILTLLFVALGALYNSESFGTFVAHAEEIAAAFIAMAPVVAGIAALEAALGLIGLFGVGTLSTGALGFVEAAAAVLLMMEALAAMYQQSFFQEFVSHASEIAAAFIAMAPVVAGLAVLEGALGVIGMLGLQNITMGALGFDVLAVCIAALLEFFGWLAQDPKFTEWITKGSEVLSLIASAVGEAIGSFVSGIGVGLTNGLPDIADNLNKFAAKMSLFVMTMHLMSNFTGTAKQAVSDITGMLGDLLGSQITQNLTGWLAGDVTLETMMEDLTTLAEGIRTFSDTISADGGLDSAAIDTAVSVIDSFAGLNDSLPKVGGIVSFFTGKSTGLDTFGEQIATLGEGVRKFSDAVSSGDGIDTYSVWNAVMALNALAGLYDRLNEVEGVFDLLKKDIGLDTFGSSLSKLGWGIRGFSTTVSGTIDAYAVWYAVQALGYLVDLYQDLNNVTGFFDLLKKDLGLDTFGSSLGKLGSGIVTFSSTVSGGVNLYSVWYATQALGYLVDMYKDLNNVESFFDLFKKDLGLDTFGTSLSKLGWGIRGFSTTVAGAVDKEAVENAVDALTKLVELQDSLDGLTAIAQFFTGKKEGDISDFGTALTDLATSLSDFSTSASQIDWEYMTTVNTGITTFSTMISDLKTIDTSGIDKFKTALSWLIDTELLSYVDEFAGLDMDEFADAIDNINSFAEMVSGLKSMDTSGVETLTTALSDISTGFTDYAEKLNEIEWETFETASTKFSNFVNSIGAIAGTTFSSVGVASVERFINSMASLPSKLANVGGASVSSIASAMSSMPSVLSSIANNAYSAITSALSGLGHSLQDIGSRAASGLASGLMGYIYSVSSAASSLAYSAAGAIQWIIGSFYEVGSAASSNLASGISNNSESASSASSSLASTAVNSLTVDGKSLYDAFYESGMWAVLGFTKGIQDYAYKAAQAAAQAASDAKVAADSTIGAASPAKEFIETGKWAMLGFAIGINKYGGEVVSSTEDVGHEMLSASSMIANAIDTSFLDDYDDPIITPVLDMTQLKSGLASAGKLLDQNAVFGSRSIAADISASANYSSKMDELISALNNKPESGEKTATINNYITVSGAENPEDYANRLARQLSMQIRMV